MSNKLTEVGRFEKCMFPFKFKKSQCMNHEFTQTVLFYSKWETTELQKWKLYMCTFDGCCVWQMVNMKWRLVVRSSYKYFEVPQGSVISGYLCVQAMMLSPCCPWYQDHHGKSFSMGIITASTWEAHFLRSNGFNELTHLQISFSCLFHFELCVFLLLKC